jgi:hypothetical protein
MVLATSTIGTPTMGARQKLWISVMLQISMILVNLQAPRQIWQSSEARLPRKVFNRTNDHPAQETEI